MTWSKGDYVEFTSLFTAYVFRGQIEGFYGAQQDVAFCTDHTGRRSRPVHVRRLRRQEVTHWYSGQVA